MAIDVDKLSVGLPDQIEFKLSNKIVNRKITISLEKWSDMSHADREAFIKDWATELLLDAATVTSQIGYAPKAVKSESQG